MTEAERDSARDSILRAARRLFAEFGFAGTSMSRLAKEAQVSQGLIHHHFQNKNALWDAVGRSFAEECHAGFEILNESEADLGTLEEMFHGHMRTFQSNPELARFTAWCRLKGDTHIDPLERAVVSAARRFIERGQAAGHIRSDITAEALLLIVGGVMEHVAAERDRLTSVVEASSSDALQNLIIDTLIQLIRPCQVDSPGDSE